MNKYISKTILLLLCITFLGNNVRAGEPISSTGYSSGKFALLGMGVTVALGLFKFAGDYIYNCRMHKEAKQKLKISSNPKNFSFHGYRIRDTHKDGKFWLTAKEILEKKEDVKKILRDDLSQTNRIYVDTMPCSLGNIATYLQDKKMGSAFDDRKTVLVSELFEKIKRAIDAEIDSLSETMKQLSSRTDIISQIKNQLNVWQTGKNQPKVQLYYENSINDFSDIFSNFTPEDLGKFTAELKEKIQKSNTPWKRVTCPRYEKLSFQYWKFVQRYARLQALRIVFDEHYKEIIEGKHKI